MEAVRSFDNPLARASENHLGVLYQCCKGDTISAGGFRGGARAAAKRGLRPIRSPEKLRRKIRQVIPPIAPHVALLRRREPVLDPMFLERIAERLRPRK